MRARWLALPFLLLFLLALNLRSAEAHPADRLLQQLTITIYGDHLEATWAVGGGLLAASALADTIDVNGDQVFSNAEAQAWLSAYAKQVHVIRDGQIVTPGQVSMTIPAYNEFSLGLSPLLITMSIPTGATVQATQNYEFDNDFRTDISDFRINVSDTSAGKLMSSPMPGHDMRFQVQVDPTVAAESSTVDAAKSWGATSAVSRAQSLFNHRKTPWFVATMLVIFAGMGALHALQPGHGKTLVAAYLVATDGTPRDGMTLAMIVTVTHTLSVYLLGLLTLLASAWILPSRVIPVLSIASGILVVAMGGSMLWRSLNRWRLKLPAFGNAASTHEHAHQPAYAFASAEPHVHRADSDHDHLHPHEHSHDHDHPHEHSHDHDHAHLTDDEHARLHAAEVQSVLRVEDGRTRVDIRQLLTLGISGGIAPCPDALAILLLSAGIGQAAFGLVAIVAFSIGLALVLVAFGVGVALLRPAAAGLMAIGGGTQGSPLERLFARFTVVSPVFSAIVVLGLGLGMLWTVIRV